MNKTEIGKYGENLALLYLKKLGYLVITTHWTCNYGEIDIIAKKETLLVFVEVKSRTSELFGTAYESIGFKKLKCLCRAINYYLLLNDRLDTLWQLDVLCLTCVGKKVKVQHFKNIIE